MSSQREQQSHLFLVRLWSEERRDCEKCEWSGRVQHVLSGEAHAFHDWPTMIGMMLNMVAEEADGAPIRAPEIGASDPPSKHESASE